MTTTTTAASRYLNVILTVNAALLAGVVWLQVAGHPLAAAATAQVPPASRDVTGIPNAGSQRQRMIEELSAMRESLEAMRKHLDSGKIKVTVANVDELKAATKAADEKGK